MKIPSKIVEVLFKDYSVKTQQRLLRLVGQSCPTVKMGQSSIVLENVHHFCDKTCGLKDHQHHFLEVHVPFKGAGVIDAEGGRNSFRLGEFAINRPEQVHCWSITEKPIFLVIFWLCLERCEEVLEPQDQLLADFFETQKIIHTLPPDFFNLYRELLAEASSPRIGLELALNNYLSQIILALARAVAPPRQLEQKILIEPGGRDERLVFIVDQFLKHNLSHELHLEDIARQVSLSPRSLTRKYREIKGRSIGEDLNSLRMYRAEELVRESDLPIKAIAWECGYPDSGYFSRKFKGFYKVTPNEYRAKRNPSFK